jgi:ABC-2 type transport system permease protein
MNHWHTLRCSTWLGWQIESNWTNPLLFLLYILVKPLAGSMMLVCMYWAARNVAGSQVAPGFLPFVYISSACFMMIGGITYGMSNAVVSDRESYGMLKFIRMSPVPLGTYLLGRGLSRAAQAAIGALLTVGIGVLLFPELRTALDGQAIAWGWLLVYVGTGAVMLVAMGLLLAGAVLNMARYGMFLSEGVGSVLYLLSGAVFPVSVLPLWLQPFSLALPPTYWLEGMRRALLGSTELQSPLSQWTHGHLALALSASTYLLVLVGQAFFRWSERRAWRLGRFDESSGN